MIREPAFPFRTRLAIGEHAKRVGQQPVARGAAEQDVIDERLAAPAGAGVALGRTRERGGLAQCAPELIATIHVPVEVAEDGERHARGVARGDPVLQGRNLFAQFRAGAVRRAGEAFIEATGLQMQGEHT